ncbi:RagB/SusD family nutrient uptake outer membrane protein [Flavobacterium sp. WC2509]|uniref:RagB/SusD family nutrient uptake outer membrane protein n=1 Tax=Flavobacterium sp. WC2509 TaxID=3461406 RepID=UPI004043FCE8
MKNKIFSLKTFLAVGVASLLLPLSSCDNEIETAPYTYFTSDTFFSNMDEAYMATLGVYQVMSLQATYGWNIPQVFDADTDIIQISGDTDVDWRTIPHYKGISQTVTFYTVWSQFYAGIDRANVVIERIPKMELYSTGTESQKTELNRMVGEAKFLRGFYYSELVRLWGDVPFKTKSSQFGDNFKGGLVDRYEIYAQIIKDMQEASLVLPEATPKDERINKWGAKAMLARIELFAGGYSLRADGIIKRPDNYKDYYVLAQKEINEIMASNPYKLNPSYSKVFKNQCQHILEPTENIFQVAFYNSAAGTTLDNTSWSGYFNAPAAPSATDSFYGSTAARCLVPKPFYTSFAAGDQRRDFSIATYVFDALGNKLARTTTTQDQAWTTAKWSREYQTNSVLERISTNINWVIMRYSDLLLMRAEVENELNEGPNAIAYDAINQVRRRGFGTDIPGSRIAITLGNKGTGYTAVANVIMQITGGGGTDAAAGVVTLASGGIGTITMLRSGDGYTSAPTVTFTTTDGKGSGATATATLLAKPTAAQVNLAGLDKANFLKAIQQERAWELSGEGMRRADLIRWGILADKITETKNAVKLIRATYPYPAFDYFTKNKHELYPFPTNETDVNKGITRQNPNY